MSDTVSSSSGWRALIAPVGDGSVRIATAAPGEYFMGWDFDYDQVVGMIEDSLDVMVIEKDYLPDITSIAQAEGIVKSVTGGGDVNAAEQIAMSVLAAVRYLSNNQVDPAQVEALRKDIEEVDPGGGSEFIADELTKRGWRKS